MNCFSLKSDNDDYNEYFYSIVEHLPKKLVEYYEESYSGHIHNRFHDCVVKNIEFKCDSYIYKKAFDSIKVVLNLGNEIEYVLTFLKIISININYNNTEAGNTTNCLGEIINCKLGLTDKNNILIEFFTSTMFEFSIEFQRIKIKKFILV